MSRPKQLALNWPPGSGSDPMEAHLSDASCAVCGPFTLTGMIFCHCCGATHFATQRTVDTLEAGVTACGKLREGGTETETRNAAAPSFETADLSNNEYFYSLCEELDRWPEPEESGT